MEKSERHLALFCIVVKTKIMSRINLLAFVAVFSMLFSCQSGENGAGVAPASSSSLSGDAEVDKKVEEIFAKMSVEDKAGQMTQVNLNKVLKTGACNCGYDNNDGTIDPALLDTALVTYRVGSLLNAINHAYELEQWHGIIKTIQDKATSVHQNIPVLYGIDAIHGTTFTLGSTLFPHNIGIAASRDPEVARVGAQVTAKEVRASGIRWNFDPVFDLGRQPLWPRFPETYGEDPLVVEKMGVATVEGYEADGLKKPTAVASCMKHFIGYSASRSGRDRTPSFIPEWELREYYLPQFQAAVNAGSSTIMINSGELNGFPVHANKYLLTDILRGELGFKGLVVTDWEDINRLHQRHMVASSMKEAVRMAVNAGVDMSMTPHDYEFTKLVIELYNEGTDKEFNRRVDESVKRILAVKVKVGLFDNAYVEEEAIAQFGKEEYKQDALNAALKSMTLLRNEESALPLAKGSKVVLAGPNANNIASMHGCWSYTWQGADQDLHWKPATEDADSLLKVEDEFYSVKDGERYLSPYPKSTVSIKTAFEQMIGAENVVCNAVPNYDDEANYELPSTAGADAIVLALGENAYAESPGSIRNLMLDERQIALAKAAVATGKKVIVVLVQGRPRIISDFANEVDGILLAYWPASQGGPAIAKTVFGENNPGGKLPFTYPKSTGDIVMYDHHWTEANVELTPGNFTDDGYKPLYPFGHGLSYSTFEYSDFTLSADTITGDEKLTVSVKVTNTSGVDGDEVVELYTRDMYASIVPSLKRLRDFQRVTIKAGETATVSFEIDADDLSLVRPVVSGRNDKFERVTEEGEFKVMIGGLGWDLGFPEDAPWNAFLSRTYTQAKGFYYKEK